MRDGKTLLLLVGSVVGLVLLVANLAISVALLLALESIRTQSVEAGNAQRRDQRAFEEKMREWVLIDARRTVEEMLRKRLEDKDE